MRIRILAIGRIKKGPERELLDDYLERARRTGAGLGVRLVEEVELPDGGGPAHEGERMVATLAASRLVKLDEKGEAWSSADFARRLSAWREAGEDVDFVIGGADGLSPEIQARPGVSLCLGRMTWPHRLARVLLAEQVYRALSIAAGTPYHRA